jgi:hypothetical protein
MKHPDTIAIQSKTRAMEREDMLDRLSKANHPALLNHHHRLARKHDLPAIVERDGLPTPAGIHAKAGRGAGSRVAVRAKLQAMRRAENREHQISIGRRFGFGVVMKRTIAASETPIDQTQRANLVRGSILAS